LAGRPNSELPERSQRLGSTACGPGIARRAVPGRPIGMKNVSVVIAAHSSGNNGVPKVSKKSVLGIFRAIFSTVLCIGVIGVIGYLIQVTLL